MWGLIASGVGLTVITKALKDHAEFAKAAARWRSSIAKAAAKHNVSPFVLASIFWRESRFNPDAVGSAGERGMGQFKPIAAVDVGIDFGTLKHDPEVQIEASAKLLRLCTDRMDGDILAALRAYNAGAGAARSDSGAGLTYALEVLQVGAVDWLYHSFATNGGLPHDKG